MKISFLLFLLLVHVSLASAAEFYVAPGAAASGDGSVSNPWRLATALDHPSAVKPGDTIWLRGGTYNGHFTSSLRGTAAAPIIVRQYPGERATLDGGSVGGRIFTITGEYTWFWGFEVMSSSTEPRYLSSTPQQRAYGFWTDQSSPPRGVKLINVIVHDTQQGMGMWAEANDLEVYGAISYNNGWNDPIRDHGPGIYTQHHPAAGTRLFKDIIITRNWGTGIQAYGSATAFLDDFQFDGGVFYGNLRREFLIGGGGIASRPKVTNSFVFDGEFNLGHNQWGGCTDAIVQNNYIYGPTYFFNCDFDTMSGNTFIGLTSLTTSGLSTADFPANTYLSGKPTTNRVFVRPNQYEPGRANIIIYNWELRNTVQVDVSGILNPGDTYILRNAENFYGDTILGTYTGSPISVPMTGRSAAIPYGHNAVIGVDTFPEFGVLVLERTSGGSAVTQVATPSINPPGGTFSSPQLVSISSATSGATVRYTTDGFPPTASSPAYTAPFTVNQTMTVRAKAYKSGMTESSQASQTFTINTQVALSLVPVTAGQTLYNGITLPVDFPPARSPSQVPYTPTYLTNPPAIIPIDVGRQLFVDDFLIQQTTLTRRRHTPVPYEDNPVLQPGGLDSTAWAGPFSDGVWYDPELDQFRMWYLGGPGNTIPPNIAYAYSDDGVNWVRPQLGVFGPTNVVIQRGRDSSTVWMDLEDPDPSRRFKAMLYCGGQQQCVYYSPDGIQFTQQPFSVSSVGDRTTFFWNPFRKVWVESVRGGSSFGRVRYYAESLDLENWNPDSPRTRTYWYGPDTNDPPYPGFSLAPQLYNLDVVAYESIMLGLFSWFYSDISLVEIGEGYSRDGFQWTRPARGAENAFIPASNIPGSWDFSNTQSAGGVLLVVGDELWFYYSGRNQRHDIVATQISTGLSKLRRDGFYSMDAGTSEGTLTTRPVTFSGSYLFVNVKNPSGELRAEILDENNNVIPPFSRANSIPVSIDSTRTQLQWQGAPDVSALRGQVVRFRFYLTNGELYSFWVSPSDNGASQGYIGAGGPGFTGPTDTIGDGQPGAPPPNDVVPPGRLAGSPVGTIPPTTEVTLSLTTGEPALCKFDNRAGIAYGSMTGSMGTGLSTSHSALVSGLQQGLSYSYYVRCQDSAGNTNPDDFPITFTINSTTTPPPPPPPPPPGGVIAIYIEGEAATSLVPPMQIYNNKYASGASYIATLTSEQGSATFTLSIPENGTYIAWGRVMAPDANRDSFYVSVDGQQPFVWESAQGSWRGSLFQWTRVTDHITTGNTEPHLFQLTAGTHTITISGRDRYAYLDQLVFTNSPSFDPEVGIVVTVRGDINGDGRVDIADLILIAREIAKAANGDPAADLNEDGSVSILDLIRAVKEMQS